MSNGLSRFAAGELDLSQLDREDELYKRALPPNRLKLGMGRSKVRVLPIREDEAALTGGMPWMLVWQHSFSAGGKDNYAVCPRMHSDGQKARCPFCEDAANGDTKLVPKRQVVVNAVLLAYAPATAKSQKDIVYPETLSVLPWSVPGGIYLTLKGWISAAQLEESSQFFDVLSGFALAVVKSPKPQARDPQRDVVYTMSKAMKRVGADEMVDRGPIANDDDLIQHILDQRKPLVNQIELYTYEQLNHWKKTGQRPDSNTVKRPHVPTLQAPTHRALSAPAASSPSLDDLDMDDLNA